MCCVQSFYTIGIEDFPDKIASSTKMVDPIVNDEEGAYILSLFNDSS